MREAELRAREMRQPINEIAECWSFLSPDTASIIHRIRR